MLFRSIVLHDMIHRVGNHGYFRARNYYVREVATGKEIDLNRVTRSMLISGACRHPQGHPLQHLLRKWSVLQSEGYNP